MLALMTARVLRRGTYICVFKVVTTRRAFSHLLPAYVDDMHALQNSVSS